MKSPKRQLLQELDYQRHKVIRRIRKRRKRLTESALKLAEKWLRKKIQRPSYDGGKDDEDEPKDSYLPEDAISVGDGSTNLFTSSSNPGHLFYQEVVIPGKKKLQSYYDANRDYASSYNPNGLMEFADATIGMPMRLLSPTHVGRGLYNHFTGNGSQGNFFQDLFLPNNGAFSDEFAREHPYITMAGNLVGDVAALGTGSTLLKMPKYRTALQAENAIVQKAVAKSWEDMFVKPTVRTKVGDVEVDNPNLLYHLDRGDGVGAFSTRGAYVQDGKLFPGPAKEDSSVAYSWWNEGEPYSMGVNGEPMTRLMTATKDTPGMLNVRSQNYRIGQWTGEKGLVLKSEYVNPEGVDVSGSTYVSEPNYGWKRVSFENIPTIEWVDATRTPQITDAARNAYERVYFGRAPETSLPMSVRPLNGLTAVGTITTIPQDVRDIVYRDIVPRLQTYRNAKTVDDVVSKILDEGYYLPTKGQWDILSNRNEKIRGLYSPVYDSVVLKPGEDILTILPHEIRHKIDERLGLNRVEQTALERAYGDDFLNVNREIGDIKDYDARPEMVTTNGDFRRELLKQMGIGDLVLDPTRTTVRKTPEIKAILDKLIDEAAESDIINALYLSNGYGDRFADYLEHSRGFTQEKINRLKWAAKMVGGVTPFMLPIIGNDSYGRGKDKHKIYIKPKNRGKFNALKKRTGKTTEQLTHSKNPLTRKRAIFALNSKKWHHK